MKNLFAIISRWVIKIIIGFFILSIVLVCFYRFVPPPFTFLMLQRSLEQKLNGEKMKMDKEWVGLDKISPLVALAVITSEDQKFEEHAGFDFEAIEKAQKYNERKKGKKVKGASTISQQTAKNVFYGQPEVISGKVLRCILLF